MRFIIALLIALASVSPDPLAISLEKYGDIESYRVTLRSGKEGITEEIVYYYKRPGFVRMEFVKPHKGAVLVYSPTTKEVRLRPFGFFKSFVLTLNPDNSLITSSKGHTVDESDIGALLKTVRELQSNGITEIRGEETVGGRTTILVSVTGVEHFTVEDDIHRYLLRLDKKTFLPLKVSSHDINGELIEEVFMDDLEINIGLTEEFFNL